MSEFTPGQFSVEQHEVHNRQTGDVMYNRLYVRDDNDKLSPVSYDAVAEAYGYRVGQPEPGSPDQQAPAPAPTPNANAMADANAKYVDVLTQFGAALNKASKGVRQDRMLDAHMAADDYAKGHDRLTADNPDVVDLNGADLKLLALANKNKQAHADRIAGDGAYATRLEKIKTNINDKIDDDLLDTEAFWSGDNTFGEEDTPRVRDEADLPPLSPEANAALAALGAARTHLAEIRAGREKRTIHRRGGEYGKKALEAALAEYEAAKLSAGLHGIERLQQMGYEDEASINGLVNLAVLNEGRDLTREQFNIETANVGNRNKLTAWYLDTWARHSQAHWRSKQGAKDMAVKAALMAPVAGASFGLGLLLTPALAGSAAALLGAGVATRVSRGLMGAKVHKEASAGENAFIKANTRLNAVHEQVRAASLSGEVVDQDDISGIYREDTNEAVKNNRKRAAKAGAMAAALGLGTSLILEHVGLDHFMHHGNGGGNADAQPTGGGNAQPQPTGGNAQPQPTGGNAQPTPAGGNAQPTPAGGNAQPVGPNGQPLTPEQVKIFNSDEFKRMVAQGKQVHEQVNAQYPIPSGADAGTRAFWEAQQNSIADRRLLDILELAAKQNEVVGSATGTASSTL